MKARQIIDNILIFLLIGISGMPFFLEYEIIILSLLNAVFFIFIFTRQLSIKKYYLFFLILFLLFSIIQYYIQGQYLLRTTMGIIARINTAYFIFTYTKDRFSDVFVRQMVILSIISLVYSGLHLLSPGSYNFLMNLSFVDSTFSLNNNIIYTFSKAYRNSGPFWESGAFSGFLIISLLIYHRNFKSFSFFDKTDLVLFISIITTFSTSGYLAFMIFYLVLFINTSTINKVVKFLFLPILFGAFGYIFFVTDFMNEKISNQWEYSLDYNSGQSKFVNTRFVVLMKDYDQFIRKPFFGWGYDNNTRIEILSTHFASITNGTSDFLVRYGIIGFLVFVIGLYYSYRRFGFSIKYSIFSIFLLFFIAFSENYFRYTFFWGLPLLSYIPEKLNE